MKSIYLVLLAGLILANLTSASWLERLERELLDQQEKELNNRDFFENTGDNEEDEDFYDLLEVLRRNNKDYLTAQKHPERLRLCVKCVGVQRDKGMNVKQATAFCNRHCKRSEIFETRFADDSESDN